MSEVCRSWCHKKESWPRFVVKAVLTLLVLIAAGDSFGSRYRIGIDPQRQKCLPGYTVYLIDLQDQVLQRGAVYAFYARNLQPFYQDGTRMVKVLAGIPGDVVAIDQTWQTKVNGRVVGEGLPLAKRLQRNERDFYGKRTLAKGHYWFMGKSPFSFDSRYWGTVKHEQIIGRAYPLL